MTFNIQKIRNDFPILHEKIRFLIGISIIIISCKPHSTEKSVINESELIYKDSILSVYFNKNLNFVDSVFFTNPRTGKNLVYYNYLYNYSPCFIEKDTLKFKVSNALINDLPVYSLITYNIEKYKDIYEHKNRTFTDVVLNRSNHDSKKIPIILVLNKKNYTIGDTLIGILIQSKNIDYIPSTNNSDTIRFKYMVNKKNDTIINKYYFNEHTKECIE
jgi:hypothetical protein